MLWCRVSRRTELKHVERIGHRETVVPRLSANLRGTNRQSRAFVPKPKKDQPTQLLLIRSNKFFRNATTSGLLALKRFSFPHRFQASLG